MGCFSGCLKSFASDQKLFCGACSGFKWSFDEFVGEKVVSSSYPSAILAPSKLMLLNCGVGEDSWESLGLQGDPTGPSWRRSVLGVHWKDWCWSWSSNTLATSCEELTHWKRPWCWEGLGAGGEGDDRGWDGWMASLTQWTWVWVNYGNWWWTGRPGVLRFMGLQRVGHDWVTELNDWWSNWVYFHVLVDHLYIFFVVLSIQVLYLYINWIAFLLLSCQNVLCIFMIDSY